MHVAMDWYLVQLGHTHTLLELCVMVVYAHEPEVDGGIAPQCVITCQ